MEADERAVREENQKRKQLEEQEKQLELQRRLKQKQEEEQRKIKEELIKHENARKVLILEIILHFLIVMNTNYSG